MTQIYITIAVIGIVALLVCYVFIKQTISERKQEKERLHRALKKRAKDLIQMLSAFPEHYLPKEIAVFVYRVVVDAYEQLTKLEPSEKAYAEGFKFHTAQMEATARQPENRKLQHLQSAAQINELRQYINILSGFCMKSMKRGQISSKQCAHYKALLKELSIHLACDNYNVCAKQAKDNGKPKLAIHFYELAKNLLLKETPADYKSSIQFINEEIPKLQELERAQLSEKERLLAEKRDEQLNQPSPEEAEWDEFQEEAGWKKKNIYD